mgnify:CR=1 FL=1
MYYNIGIKSNNKSQKIHLNDYSHLYVSGVSNIKTKLLQSIVHQLMLNESPQNVKFILVDTLDTTFKFIQLGNYECLPHLENKNKVFQIVDFIHSENKRRYNLIQLYGYHTFDDYNNFAQTNQLEILPRIILIIDNYDSLKQNYLMDYILANTVKTSFDVGIHVILSTNHINERVFNLRLQDAFRNRLAFKMDNDFETRVFARTDDIEHLNEDNAILTTQHYNTMLNIEKYLENISKDDE